MKHFQKTDYFKRLTDCSREEDENNVSEYDTMLAILRMSETFTEDELRHEIDRIQFDKAISSLVDNGTIKMDWDPVAEEFIFFKA